MAKTSFHHLTIFILAVCAWFSFPPAARADGPNQVLRVESTDVGAGRPHNPMLISAQRDHPGVFIDPGARRLLCRTSAAVSRTSSSVPNREWAPS
ncbi:MAG: hypothetical protein Q8Q62_09235 [Mesorhizobium sp.]|nr:hypothetical protein [Mesorhizobium sp.]